MYVCACAFIWLLHVAILEIVIMVLGYTLYSGTYLGPYGSPHLVSIGARWGPTGVSGITGFSFTGLPSALGGLRIFLRSFCRREPQAQAGLAAQAGVGGCQIRGSRDHRNLKILH